MSDYLRHLIRRSLDKDTNAPSMVMPRLPSTYATSARSTDPIDGPEGYAGDSADLATLIGRDRQLDHRESAMHHRGSTAPKEMPGSPHPSIGLRSVLDRAAVIDDASGAAMQSAISERRTLLTGQSGASRTSTREDVADSVAPADENRRSPIDDACAASQPIAPKVSSPVTAEPGDADQTPAVTINTLVPERHAPRMRASATSGSAVRRSGNTGAGAERQALSVAAPEQVVRSSVSQARERIDRTGIFPADTSELARYSSSAGTANLLAARISANEPERSRQVGQNGVTINIDRIEIRAVHPPAPRTTSAQPQPQPPKLSLEDYLKQRNGDALE